jgi:hypothetical protein
MNPAALLLVTALIPSQDTGATKAPTGEHRHQVDQNGDRAMGFSHEKTTHHFLLEGRGGVIQVAANTAGDKESRDQIQTHLGHIAKMFAEGDFNTPMLVHSVMPPGTATMTRLKAEIRYSYEPSPKGGRVVIATSNQEALEAIHEFLRFQIKDHNTGDPLTIGAKK